MIGTGLSVKMTGFEQLQRGVADMAARGKKVGPFLASVGYRLAVTDVPQSIADNKGRWGRPGAFPRAYRAEGQSLLDTGRLVQSMGYSATDKNVEIGTAVVYARILQKGGTIVPKRAKWLALPLSPPLSKSEARNASPRSFRIAFVRMKGPEGPGLYRPKGSYAAASKRGSLSIERIFAFVKKVTIRPFRFMRWYPEWVDRTRLQAAEYVGTGKLPYGSHPFEKAPKR